MNQVLESQVVLLVCCLFACSFAATTPAPKEDLTTTLANFKGTTSHTTDVPKTTVSSLSVPNNATQGSTADSSVSFQSTNDPTSNLESTASSSTSSQVSTRRSTTQPPASITTTSPTTTTFTTTNPERETSTWTQPTSQATPPAVFHSTSPADTTKHSTHNVTLIRTPVTEGLNLNNSERNMTIVFSVVLAVFVLGSIICLLHRCKQRLQYSHHPLHTDQFQADDDTLVISGGLYDGHALFDQPQPTSEGSVNLQFINERAPTLTDGSLEVK